MIELQCGIMFTGSGKWNQQTDFRFQLRQLCSPYNNALRKGLNPFSPLGQIVVYSMLLGHQLWANIRASRAL